MIAHPSTIASSVSNRIIDLDAASPRVAIRPHLADGATIDVTDTIVAAIAAEIGVRYGGNAVLNLIEARRLLDDLIHRGGAAAA
ncbi:MAG: hypothetical protein U0572_17120 [Phycisphaerales bacterium]